MKNIKYTYGGISIIGLLVFVIITVLILSYFNINVKKIAQSPTGQTNINYVTDNTKTIAKTTWQKYLKDEIVHTWNDVVVKIFLKSFVDTMMGKGIDYQNIAPVVPLSTSNINSNQ